MEPVETLLDEVGRPVRQIEAAEAANWRRELASAGLAASRAAVLRLQLGEYELACNEEPDRALVHFQAAGKLGAGNPELKALARYNSALALFYQRRYRKAANAFKSVLEAGRAAVKAGVRGDISNPGVSARRAVLWYQRAASCAGYHEEHAKLGIPQGEKLDSWCAAAGLAVCLRSLGLPYDKASVAKVCRVTGMGSTTDDLRTACEKLGLSGRLVRADEAGLRLLPKPLVAHVEHDHFVAVTSADDRGVTYTCTDCGCWPGGAKRLTWRQWRAMEADSFFVVTRKETVQDRALARLPESGGKSRPSGVEVASAAPGAGLDAVAQVLAKYQGHVLAINVTDVCGSRYVALRGPFANNPYHGQAGSDGGPLGGDPVNLATLEEEYKAPADLQVYNPNGPLVRWQRFYNSLRGRDDTNQIADFGPCWSHPYKLSVYDPSAKMNQQIQVGVQTDITWTTQEAPPAGLTWDITRNGSTVATSAAANGWAVSFPQAVRITPPTTATIGTNYRVRITNGTTAPAIYFDLLPTGKPIPQGVTANIAWDGTDAPTYLTGNDAPNYGYYWDIVRNGAMVASSAQKRGWTVTGWDPIRIGAPITATAAGGYEIRIHVGYQFYRSAFFSVIPYRLQTFTGTKYLLFPQGGRVSFTANSVPTAAQPTVACTVQNGAALAVDWAYDANSPAGYYVVTMPDGTRWSTTAVGRSIRTSTEPITLSASLLYPLGALADRVGNSLSFYYRVIDPDGNPLLSTISDASTGSALLQITRADDRPGNITSVSDCYGRSVYYHYGLYGAYGPWSEVDQVSQIVPRGRSTRRCGRPTRTRTCRG